MRNLSLAAASLVLFGTIAGAAAPPQSSPTELDLPFGGQSYRFHASTRSMEPLETVKSRKERGSKEYCYIEGDTSPVVLRSDETLAFASRTHGSTKEIEGYASLVAPVMKLFKLERLFASDKNRRYATGQYVPMNGMAYGDPIPNVNPKRPKDVGQLYISRPASLPPGEYAITIGGMFVIGMCGGPVSAFRIQ